MYACKTQWTLPQLRIVTDTNETTTGLTHLLYRYAFFGLTSILQLKSLFLLPRSLFLLLTFH